MYMVLAFSPYYIYFRYHKVFVALAKQLRAAGLLRLDPVGRTLFIASLVPLPFCGIAIGCVVAVLFGDPWSADHVRVRYAKTAVAQFFWSWRRSR